MRGARLADLPASGRHHRPGPQKKFYLKNLCGNPYDTGVAVAHLIFGGVMDRFPKLEVNLPHAGGTSPG